MRLDEEERFPQIVLQDVVGGVTLPRGPLDGVARAPGVVEIALFQERDPRVFVIRQRAVQNELDPPRAELFEGVDGLPLRVADGLGAPSDVVAGLRVAVSRRGDEFVVRRLKSFVTFVALRSLEAMSRVDPHAREPLRKTVVQRR